MTKPRYRSSSSWITIFEEELCESLHRITRKNGENIREDHNILEPKVEGVHHAVLS